LNSEQNWHNKPFITLDSHFFAIPHSSDQSIF